MAKTKREKVDELDVCEGVVGKVVGGYLFKGKDGCTFIVVPRLHIIYIRWDTWDDPVPGDALGSF